MVNTRSSARVGVNNFATAAIAQGGNRALRKALGIKTKTKKAKAVKSNVCASEVSNLRSQISRLKRVISNMKNGRKTTIQRASSAAPSNNYRTINHFRKEQFMMGGQPYQDSRVLWRESQVPNSKNRNMALYRRAGRPGFRISRV